MKKLVLIASIAAWSLGASAQELNWARTIDSSNSESPNSIIESADGGLLTFCNFGSRSDGNPVYYNGKQVGAGCATMANSDNYNALVMKLDSNGELLWNVYSNSGDLTINSSNIAATADGGAVLALKMRYASGYPEKYPKFTDADGSEWTLENWNTGYRVQYIVILKIGNLGDIEWVKKVEVDTKPEELASYYTEGTPDGVDPYAIAVDAEQNIYIAGRYRKTLVFTNANNGTVTLTPHNVAEWDGDPQDTNGDLLLVKMDNEGNYVDHITSKGIIARDQIVDMLYDNGKLYFAGNMKSNDGTTVVSIDGKNVTPTLYDDIVIGCIDVAGFTAEWISTIQAFPASNGKHTTQVKRLQMIDNELYVMGHIVGGFGANGAAQASIASTGTMQEGFIVKYSATDGSWLGGAVNGKSIGGYYGAFKSNNTLYAFGYKLGSIFLDIYDESSWERTRDIEIISGGGMSTAWSCLKQGNTLYTFTRSNSDTSTFYNSDVTTETQGWGNILASWNVENLASAIQSATADGNTRIYGEEGGVKIVCNEATDVAIYNTVGQIVYSGKAAEGSNFVSLPQGVYIVNDKKVITF